MATATQIGVFFDGTGNNMKRDTRYGCESNIAKLYILYNTAPYQYKNDDIINIKKIYVNGIGSVLGSRLIGGITGLGAQQRLSEAYFKVKAYFDEDVNRACEKKYIDVFGFSRGASLARHFVNMIKNIKIQDGESENNHTGVEVRFLGIFDTVSSFGLPGNRVDVDFDFNIKPGDVSQCLHLTAAHERRGLFGLQSIRDGVDASLPDRFEEYTCPGAHSDVGGGYRNTPHRKAGWYKQRIVNGELVDIEKDNMKYEGDEYLTDDARFAQEENEDEDYYLPEEPEKSNELSRVPFNIMYQEIVKSGIKMKPQTEYPKYSACIKVNPDVQAFFDQNKNGLIFDDAIRTKYVHDSRFVTDKIDPNKERDIYFNQAKNVNWQEQKEILQGVWDTYDEENA